MKTVIQINTLCDCPKLSLVGKRNGLVRSYPPDGSTCQASCQESITDPMCGLGST